MQGLRELRISLIEFAAGFRSVIPLLLCLALCPSCQDKSKSTARNTADTKAVYKMTSTRPSSIINDPDEELSALARKFGTGTESEADSTRAVARCRTAAEQGDPASQVLLGLWYQNGYIHPKDDSEAFKWFSKAAGAGHAHGQYEVGRCYLEGWGTRRDKEAAAVWFTKAAEQNHAEAQCFLAQHYRKSNTIPYHDKKAFEWFKRSAENGHPAAQIFLGMAFLNGQGTEKNLVEAYKWLYLGDLRGCKSTNVLVGLDGKLSPSERKGAKDAAVEMNARMKPTTWLVGGSGAR